jgi:hypothetical protein
MFKYDNLPDTIPKRTLELYLQINGSCGFYDYQDNLYCLQGSLGGEPDYNYMPTIFTFSNPALEISENLKINDECIIISNDDMYMGLYPLMRKYATMLTENEISMLMCSILSRIPTLISAKDDTTMESAKKFIKDIIDGKLGVIAESEFFDGLKSQPVAGTNYTNTLRELIEHEQYLKASFFNDIGLNANYNMKRESLNSNESQLNDDMLYPMIDNMLEKRKEGIDQVNKKFGTNITVEFNSSWEDNEIEKEQLLDDPEGDISDDQEGCEPNNDVQLPET